MTQQQLEKYLWGAATLLRGTIDAGDYKQFIFPLLFYKRLCDVFDEEVVTALRESDGDQDTSGGEIELVPEVLPDASVWRTAVERAALLFGITVHDRVTGPELASLGAQVRARAGDPNLNVILETLTAGGLHLAMAQRYIPEIVSGDKRILLIDGVPVDYCLARIPQGDEFRGNLAAGGRGEGQPLSERDRWIASARPWALQRDWGPAARLLRHLLLEASRTEGYETG